MTKYRAEASGRWRIEPIEVISETTLTVVREYIGWNGQMMQTRIKKNAKDAIVADTWDAAFSWLFERATECLRRAQETVEHREETLNMVKSLKPPTP